MAGAPIPECLGGDPGENCQPIQLVILCDDNGPFLRRYIINCDNGTILGFADSDFAGAPYAPVGAIGFCEAQGSCNSMAHRENFLGPFVWNLPPNAISVTVKCRAVGVASPSSVTITDAANVVSELFVGDEETWAAQPGSLLGGNFTIIGTEITDFVTVLWTECVSDT